MKKLTTLAFALIAGLSANAQLQNGGMETWNTYISDTATLEQPDYWFGSDSLAYAVASSYLLEPKKQIFEDAYSHSGSSAAKLVSEDIGGLVGVAPGVLTNGQISVDIANQTFSYTGGTPVTQRITFMNCWIDYQPQGTDGAMIMIQAVLAGQGVGGADSVVGIGEYYNDGTSGYEHVGIPVTYADANVVPDKVLIAFWSSEELGTGTEGSILYVDDVTLSTTSVKNTTANNYSVKCFPNPTNGILNVRSATNEALKLNVYNVTGQAVHMQAFSGNTVADLSGLANGMYFYKICNSYGEVLRQEKLVLNK